MLPKLTKLEYLDLCTNKLEDNGILALFEGYLATQDSLRTLKLNFNKIRQLATVEKMAKLLEDSNAKFIKSLGLKMCALKPDMLRVLIKQLRSSLEELDFSSNQLGNDGLIALK